MKRIVSLMLAAASSFAAFAAPPQWPERPVKIIVPFPAGGPADVAVRIVGNRLGTLWNQPVVVENKPGAPGIVSVASASADGYTLLLGAGSSIVTAPLVNPRLAYKPTDFAPVSNLVTSSSILTVNPRFPARTTQELITYAKAHPGEVNYSSPGIGSPGHLMMELFQQRTGTKLVHIPYKGGVPAVAELVAGHVQVGVNATPSVIQYVQTNKLHPLAVTSKRRDAHLPDVPTMQEAGLPQLEFAVWYGIFAPTRTPTELIEKASAGIRKVLADPEVQKLIKAQGNETAGSTPQQLAELVKTESQLWSELIRSRKLSIDE